MVKYETKNGSVKMRVEWNPDCGPKMTVGFNKAQQFIDSECLKLCDLKIPKDTGILKQSGIMNTNIGEGKIVYRTPYARRWYYMPAQFQGAPQRGNYWFTRMAQQYKAQILDGAKKLAGAK